MTTQENIDLICAQLEEMGLGNLPAYRRWVTEGIFGEQEKFAIMIFADKPQEYFTCAIDCQKVGNEYHLPAMMASYIPRAIIQHIDHKGINTAELQRRMERVNWNDEKTSQFFRTIKEGERPLNHTEQFVHDIFRDVHLLMQSGHTQAAGVSLQLQHNFWYGKLFGVSIGMNAEVGAFCPVVRHRFDLDRQIFRIDEIFGLLNFRPVRKKIYAVPGGESFQWFQLSRQDRDVRGHYPLKSYPDIDLQPLLEQLPPKIRAHLSGAALDNLYTGKQVHFENGQRKMMISLDAASRNWVIEDPYRNTYGMDVFTSAVSKKIDDPKMSAAKKRIAPTSTPKRKDNHRKGRTPGT